MRGDMPAAALRLSTTLPCRTHEQRRQDYADRHSANHVRACIVRGVHYESVAEAARTLHKCRDTIRRMIASGKARYAK